MANTKNVHKLILTGLIAVVGALMAVSFRPVVFAAPGSPGVPEAPTVLFNEDFENAASTSPVGLMAYTGASGMTYTASAPWLTNCNGEVLFFAMNDTEFANSNCSVGDGSNITMAFDAVRRLAYALGTLSTGTDSANRALTAYTDAGNVYVDPGPNLTQFETADDIDLPQGTRRFVVSRLDSAAINCTNPGTAHSKLIVYLLDGSSARQINQQPINVCTDASSSTVTPPSLQSNGAIAPNSGTIKVGSFLTDTALLSNSAAIGVRIVNQEGSGQGNDNALDNIQLVDASPKLDKSFSPAKVSVGKTSRMTFTVTNTTDLLAKNGWSFTDTLPVGLLVAEDPHTETDCPNGTIGYPADRKRVDYAGDLHAGQTSCTLSLDVTSANATTYTNGPANLSSVVGLHLPADADVTFVAAAPNTGVHRITTRPLWVGLSTVGAATAIYLARRRFARG